jgi:hypothetical protein
MPKYTLSFTIESDTDPSDLLAALHDAAVTLAAMEAGVADADVEDVEDSCCVALVEDE